MLAIHWSIEICFHKQLHQKDLFQIYALIKILIHIHVEMYVFTHRTSRRFVQGLELTSGREQEPLLLWLENYGA